MYSLIIFDIDGTLTETKSGATFRKSADDWQLLPGRAEKLHTLNEQNVKLAIATNQGGVAFGYMQVTDILHELIATATALHVSTSGVYVCYTHPKASVEQYRAVSDSRRKPGPGMLLEAMRDVEVSPDETLYVGDRPEDEQAAKAAGVAFQWAVEFFRSE